MTEQRNNSSSARRNTSRRSAQAGASQPVASEADALVGRINDRRQQRSQNAVERIRNLIRIGGDLARLKEISKELHPDWNGWVQQEFDFTSTGARQRILLHQNWGKWAETAAARPLLERAPCDLAKLEWLCQLPAGDLEGLLDSNDCHDLSVVALRKEAQARLRVVTLLKDFDRVIARADNQVPDLTAEQRALLVESLAARVNEALGRWRADSAEEDADSDSGEGEQEEPAAARAADGEEPEVSDDSGDDEEDQQNDDHDDDEDEDQDEDDQVEDQQNDDQEDEEEDKVEVQDEDDEDDEDDEPAPRPRARRRGS